MGSASLNPTMGRVLVLAILVLHTIVSSQGDAGSELKTIGENLIESPLSADLNTLKSKREAATTENNKKARNKKKKKTKKKKNGKKLKEKKKKWVTKKEKSKNQETQI